jgi:lysophospholipase L1-like esterase
VRHGAIPDRLVAVNHREWIDYRSRIRLAVMPRGAPIAASTMRTFQLHLAPGPGSFSGTHRLVLGRAALGAVRRGRVRLIVRVEDAVKLDGRGRPDATSRDRGILPVAVRRVHRAPALPPPRCERFTHVAKYAASSEVVLVCMGNDVSFAIARRPRHGSARILDSGAGRLRLEYRPATRYVGPDSLAVRATAGTAAGDGARASAVVHTVRVDVQPFKLRALGDSVSAGFGYFGSGQIMGDDQLVKCEPPDRKNDRCSSNSSNGPDATTADLNYLSDYGLANSVAWSAQYAGSAGLTRKGQFENRAVSGSTPANWGTGGFLNPQLQSIVAAKPDLTVLTLGANPLLDTFLEGDGRSCGNQRADQPFIACVQGFVDQVKLVSRLRSVLAQLLAAPKNTVVVSQYHLATPGFALVEFTPHQLELLTDTINENIEDAVQGSAGYGRRLLLMAPPRFNLGLGPGNVTCPGKAFKVDGPSRQSPAAQTLLPYTGAGDFCGSNEYWTINADSGIHPSVDGYAQYANALAQVVRAYDLLPPLPQVR